MQVATKGAEPEAQSAAKKLNGLGSAEDRVDQENWQFDPMEFQMLNLEYGPVDIDCCANSTNHLVKDYYSRAQSFLDAKISGKTLWINPPFFKAGQFLQYYLAEKSQAPSSTAASSCFPTGRGNAGGVW